MNRFLGAGAIALMLLYHCAHAQVIEVESNGLKYQTLTRSGVTIMFAHLPGMLHEYSIVQVAVSNGSPGPYVIRPEDFTFVRTDGTIVHAAPARAVVDMLFKKANGNDVIKLVTTYEAGIYGNPNLKSLHGYEDRRQAAIAATGTKARAAAVASAIAMVQTKLIPGDSTDGAIFFPTVGKSLGSGRLIIRTNTDEFQFNPEEANGR
jgi:hypothetical protein